MLHRGALGQREVVDQRGGLAREGARLDGRTLAPAPPVVGAVRGDGVLGLGAVAVGTGGGRGGRSGRAHTLVGRVEQLPVLVGPAVVHLLAALRRHGHSHSMVPGGFDVTSSATRFTPSTSLMMREAMRSTRS